MQRGDVEADQCHNNDKSSQHGLPLSSAVNEDQCCRKDGAVFGRLAGHQAVLPSCRYPAEAGHWWSDADESDHAYMIKRYPLVIFTVLTFGLTWVVWIPRAAGVPVPTLGQLWTWMPAVSALLAALLLPRALPSRRSGRLPPVSLTLTAEVRCCLDRGC